MSTANKIMWKEGLVGDLRRGPLWNESWTMRRRCPCNDLGEGYSQYEKHQVQRDWLKIDFTCLSIKSQYWIKENIEKLKVAGEAIRERQGADNAGLLRPTESRLVLIPVAKEAIRVLKQRNTIISFTLASECKVDVAGLRGSRELHRKLFPYWRWEIMADWSRLKQCRQT